MIDSLITEAIDYLIFCVNDLLLGVYLVGSLDSSSIALSPFFMLASKFKHCFADSTFADRKKS